MAEVPYRVEKPWGYELIWACTDRYVGKVLHVRAGHVLSLQYHNRKDETMHVLRGELVLRTQPGDRLEERAFRAGETVHIPPKLIHQKSSFRSRERGPGCVPIPIWCPSRCSRWRAGR